MKSKRILSAVITLWICCSAVGSLVWGATAIKINSASYNLGTNTIVINGINFDAFGLVNIAIGDIDFTPICTVEPSVIECSIDATPVEAGGTWVVAVSAGNGPHVNARIDVFVPTLSALVQCAPEDIVGCYPGDPDTRDVGECQSGIRTCQSDGLWGACEGAVTPVNEICNNLRDDDCDGFIDSSDPECDYSGAACNTNADCGQYADSFCKKYIGQCGGQGSCAVRPLFCPDGVPGTEVCGCNGITYSDSCNAWVEGVNIDYNGICGANQDSDGDGWTPLEGDCDDGIYEINPGVPEECYDGLDNDCDGFADELDGDCSPPPECNDSNSCTSDSYDHITQQCVYDAEPNGTPCGVSGSCSDGICVESGDCPSECPNIYNPVCGDNGITYNNECEAICDGAAIAYPGACN